jgi:hypothetical protein
MEPTVSAKRARTRLLTCCLSLKLFLVAQNAPALADFLTPENHPYRIAEPGDAGCKALAAEPTVLRALKNDETAAPADGWWECMLQRHVNSEFDGSAGPTVSPILDRGAYSLAFIEFGEDGQQLLPIQQQVLFDHLRAQKHNYVVTFVHGWRNDASRGNGNIRQFRMLLSYAKSALESRCREARRYCDVTLTGVFIGWRGQVLSSDGDDLLSNAKAAVTMFSRKPASDRIGHGIVAFIKELSGLLDARNAKATGRYDRDHMMSIGHSLGGNALITGFAPEVLSAVASHKKDRLMRAPAGDLIVLLNPAAEARKWTQLQDAVAQKGADDFSANQMPVLVSLTTTCNYSTEELKAPDLKDRPIECDTATSKVFPAFKILSFDFWEEDRTTIGNLDPAGDSTVRSGHGTTHEFDLNGALRKPTQYDLASDPNYAQCRIADGWLTYAKQRQYGGLGWDAGFKTKAPVSDDDFALDPLNDAVFVDVPDEKLDEDQLDNIGNADLRVRGQFMHGIYRHGGPMISSPNDPLWNTRAIDNAVRAHNGIFSPMTWCALHQLVLDDVAGPPLYAKQDIWKPRKVHNRSIAREAR